jgi:hypothetical protein
MPFLARLAECLTPDGETVVRIALSMLDARRSVDKAKTIILAEMSKIGWHIDRMVAAVSNVREALAEV